MPTTPESPPTPPVIPEGLATELGKGFIAIFLVISLVTTVLDGDHTPETLMALGSAVATLLTLMAGRYLQAAAVYRGDPAKPLTAPVEDLSEIVETEAIAAEEGVYQEPTDTVIPLDEGDEQGAFYGKETYEEPPK